RKACEEQFIAKVHGLLALYEIFKEPPPDLCFISSSISAVLGGLGFAAYAAANIFSDHFTASLVGTSNWFSIDFDGLDFREESDVQRPDYTMNREEGLEVFNRLLSLRDVPNVVVSLGDLKERLNLWVKAAGEKEEADFLPEALENTVERPDLPTPYVEPRGETERELADLWRYFFRMDKIGIKDDFFQLGGDSLLAITMLTKIRKSFNVNVPVADFFAGATIEGLASAVGGAGESNFTAVVAVEKKEYYVLSSAQRRLFFIQRLNPGSTAYNVPNAVLLNSPVERSHLSKTFERLLDRHESFRTSLEVVDGEPVQRVHDSVPFAISFADKSSESWLSAPAGERKKALEEFIRPFDLSKAPLLRVALIKVAPQKHILLVDIHHIISDGITHKILTHDFLAFYRGMDLEPLDIQYKDYALWQNSRDVKENLAQQEKYWLEVFSGDIPVLQLPTDFSRPQNMSVAGDVFDFSISPEDSTALKKLALEKGVTIHMVLSTVFYILLFKLTRQEDIVVGIPVVGRAQPELENIIGMFI
ncbi:MAG: KR domain-containing protein, partial [bacterium]|nr:KR domain-containing protein [bacterium]